MTRRALVVGVVNHHHVSESHVLVDPKGVGRRVVGCPDIRSK